MNNNDRFPERAKTAIEKAQEAAEELVIEAVHMLAMEVLEEELMAEMAQLVILHHIVELERLKLRQDMDIIQVWVMLEIIMKIEYQLLSKQINQRRRQILKNGQI